MFNVRDREYRVKSLKTERVAKNLLKFTTPIVLEEKETTRRCFYGELARDEEDAWNLRGGTPKEVHLNLSGPTLKLFRLST